MNMKTPLFWYSPASWQSFLLLPFACLYRLGRALDVFFHKPKSFSVPVYCIGNVVAGGAGKTPTAMALLDFFDNKNVHVVLRGYGGNHKGPLRVTEQHTAEEVGDEALLFAARAPTWVALRRKQGVQAAIDAGADIVLLDDGLQNTSIAPTKSLLVVDATAGFGNGYLLPAGPLRETLRAAANKIDAVVLVGEGEVDLSLFAGKPTFKAQLQADRTGLDISARYVAFSGIGRPDKFFATARAIGLMLAHTISYPDHHVYSMKDWHYLLRQARECNAHLLTTAKDAVRLSPTQRAQVRVLPVKLVFHDEQGIKSLLQQWQSSHHA